MLLQLNQDTIRWVAVVIKAEVQAVVELLSIGTVWDIVKVMDVW